MPGKFTIRFPLRYQDTDSRLCASLTALLGAMQEAAILHAEAVGRGIHWLGERDLSWMITQTHLRIQRRPAWGDSLLMTTWPSDIGRLLSRREFVLQDERHVSLLKATTLWAFMNTAKRKVTRVPAEVRDAYQIIDERALDKPFRRPAALEQAAWELKFPVRRWQIDSNGHVNNLRYLDWMLETLPATVLDHHLVDELNIRYQKEVAPGKTVTARSGGLPETADGRIRFAHAILDEASEPVALAESVWARQTGSPAPSGQ